MTIVQPAASAGPPFPADHQDWKVPGNDLSNHADRLAARIGKIGAADRNGLAVELICIAGVITQTVDGQGQVRSLGVADRLAVVQ